MRWFIVRFSNKAPAADYAMKTRKLANRLRDLAGSKFQTVEVVPVGAITKLLDEWDAMANKSLFENGPLTDGEVAIIKAMRQDLQERLDSL
jgi:hypothetical protein